MSGLQVTGETCRELWGDRRVARETEAALLAAASSPAASELDDVRRRPTVSTRSEADPRKRTVCRLPTSAAVSSRPPQPTPPLRLRPPAPLHSPIDIVTLLFFPASHASHCNCSQKLTNRVVIITSL